MVAQLVGRGKGLQNRAVVQGGGSVFDDEHRGVVVVDPTF